MRDKPFQHPLAALRHELDLTSEQYLERLSPIHAALGYGHLSTRREKVTRWESGVHAPEMVTQYAMAAFHDVPREAVDEMGWPHWLLIAFPDDQPILDSPWTPVGTVRSVAAAARGGSVDRRGFLIASGATLATVTAGWSDALDTTQAVASTRGRRRLTAETVTRLEQRLDDLRRLDDVLGGGELRPAAATELRILNALANDATYDETVGRRLLAALAEASRMCGWLHFDAGRHAGAQSFYITALRASATAGDPATGANILAFMAIQTYSIGNPQDAVNLVRTAQEQIAGHSTPRVRAMLHARAARALSKTGDRTACARELDAARDAYAQGTHDDDPPWSYWLDAGEIEMLSGSSALDLGDPRRALHHFEAAYEAAYAADGYVRDHALYLTRAAQAHLDLGDLDAACVTATKALAQTGGVDSSRPSDALDDIRTQLLSHRHVRAVREFLRASA